MGRGWTYIRDLVIGPCVLSLNAITNRGLPLRSLDAGRSPAHFSCTFTSLGRKKNKIPNEGLACSDAVSLNVI